MKTKHQTTSTVNHVRFCGHWPLWLAALACGVAGQLLAATVTIYTNDFEAYSSVATNLTDTTDADPTGSEWTMVDDDAVSPTTPGAGVQVQTWLTHGGSKALLLRAGATEAGIWLPGMRSGSQYTLDFWLYVHKGTGTKNFRFGLQGEGADLSGSSANDFLAWGSVQSASTLIRYYDGVANPDDLRVSAWVQTNLTAVHTEDTWQHHRIVTYPRELKMAMYIDNMVTPVITNADLSRCEVALPTYLRILHEGTAAADGYVAIDDITLTVEDSVDLTATFTEGFESYTARVAADDDADPGAPWIVTELAGTGVVPLAPAKVQVVDNTVVEPHLGTKCLKLEGGQRAGASLAWGVPPQSDVQITWWARVPQSATGGEYNYLRMSLYGTENGNTLTAGDCALLGYGCRSSTVGDTNSLTYYLTPWAIWIDSGADYTPDAWEEYQLTTHTASGQYTLVKNPSSSPVLITYRAPMIGGAATWTPIFMAAWSSSNGSGHPPVYVDDIEIKSLVSVADPLPEEPYIPTINGSRFTTNSELVIGGTVGDVVVDPSDNTTILFARDSSAATGGGIYRAYKVASGNWAVDPTPVVGNLNNPSGLVIAPDGALWWIHDGTAALMRLKAPWSANTPETVINQFNGTTDDDPIDLAFTPANWTGAYGLPNWIVIADCGADLDNTNAVYLVNPAVTPIPATCSSNLVPKTTTLLGNTSGGTSARGRLNAITPLPATGEVVALAQDGTITAIDGSGALRYIFGTTLWPLGSSPQGRALAVDPTTSRLWLAANESSQVWSVDPSVSPSGSDIQELSFPLVSPPWRPEREMEFHNPGMAFSPDGAFLVVTDLGGGNNGGRLQIFHSEPIGYPSISITNITRAGQNVTLGWQTAGFVTYSVLRGTSVDSYQPIVTNLLGLTFTDTNAPAGGAYYRINARYRINVEP